MLAVLGVAALIASMSPWPAAVTLPPAAATALADRGRTLFTTKGCIGCHRHDDVERSDSVAPWWGGDYDAPNLTVFSADPDYLRQWLSNPAAVRPGTYMPDLDLSDSEIEALIAFINS